MERFNKRHPTKYADWTNGCPEYVEFTRFARRKLFPIEYPNGSHPFETMFRYFARNNNNRA